MSKVSNPTRESTHYGTEKDGKANDKISFRRLEWYAKILFFNTMVDQKLGKAAERVLCGASCRNNRGLS
jgi:hypothetical protein